MGFTPFNFRPENMKPCISCRNPMTALKALENNNICYECQEYGYPREYNVTIPYPCRNACGQLILIKSVTTPKGAFKTNNRVNCDKCIKEKKK